MDIFRPTRKTYYFFFALVYQVHQEQGAAPANTSLSPSPFAHVFFREDDTFFLGFSSKEGSCPS